MLHTFNLLFCVFWEVFGGGVQGYFGDILEEGFVVKLKENNGVKNPVHESTYLLATTQKLHTRPRGTRGKYSVAIHLNIMPIAIDHDAQG